MTFPNFFKGFFTWLSNIYTLCKCLFICVFKIGKTHLFLLRKYSYFELSKGVYYIFIIKAVITRSVFVCLQCPATEGTAFGSPTEIHLSFAKAGAKLIEMPVFVCFLCAEWVFLCWNEGEMWGFTAEKWRKTGVLWLKFWGCGGDAKRQGKYHIFDFGTLFVVRVHLCI